MELLETLRLFLQCCNSDQRLRSRSSLRSRPLPQKKSILGPILSFVLDIENLQHNFSCLKRHFHFLGLTASLGLNVQPWSEYPAEAFGLGWTTFRPWLTTPVRPRKEKFLSRHEKFGFYYSNSCTFTFPTKERIFYKLMSRILPTRKYLFVHRQGQENVFSKR